MIHFTTTRTETDRINEIAKRAVRLGQAMNVEVDYVDIGMDVTACHCNGCPLRLDDLLRADDANFGHDVFGIRRHIDRKTGELGVAFLPRYAKRAEEPSTLPSMLD